VYGGYIHVYFYARYKLVPGKVMPPAWAWRIAMRAYARHGF
jgi:hypothetical protein